MICWSHTFLLRYEIKQSYVWAVKPVSEPLKEKKHLSFLGRSKVAVLSSPNNRDRRLQFTFG